MAPNSDAEARSAALKNSFQKLSTAAQTLNQASDVFGASIANLDEALNKLNPGVAVWVMVTSWSLDDETPWERREERIGYAKVAGRWGLCISVVDVEHAEDSSEQTRDLWLFNDAPRQVRIRAVEHIPELIEALARETESTAKRVTEQARFAAELSKSVNTLWEGKGARR